MAKVLAYTLENLASKAMSFSNENNEMYQDHQTQERKPEDHEQ